VTYDYYYTPTLGNDASDDFGKFPLEGGKSRSRFLGDEFRNDKSDKDEKGFSPHTIFLDRFLRYGDEEMCFSVRIRDLFCDTVFVVYIMIVGVCRGGK